MRHLQIALIAVASLALTALLGSAGCDPDYGDRSREHYERHDSDRHEERHDSDRHEDRGGDSGRDRAEHGDR